MINNSNIPLGNIENYWKNFSKKSKNAWGWKKPKEATSPKGIEKDIKKDKKVETSIKNISKKA